MMAATDVIVHLVHHAITIVIAEMADVATAEMTDVTPAGMTGMMTAEIIDAMTGGTIAGMIGGMTAETDAIMTMAGGGDNAAKTAMTIFSHS